MIRAPTTASSTRSLLACWIGVCSAAGVGLAPRVAAGQAALPAPHDEQAFDVMNVLADRGVHDIQRESWNVYGQFTYISSYKAPFSAAYTNLNNSDGGGNSLSSEAEHSFTASFTLFAGVRLWPGGEAYLVPEVISEQPLSGLHGLGGAIQNFELQKTGATSPQLYRARAFVRQTFGLGGGPEEKTSDPLQLGGVVDRRRIVVTAGNFTILDLFDRSSVTGDPRQTFFNMAFMTHGSWDFAADARGYSWGAAVELVWDRWAARIGRMAPPKNPNELAVDFRLHKYYGDALELERDYELFGQEGAVRVLGYRNYEVIGRFDDAVAAFLANPQRSNAANCGTNYNYGSRNPNAPDLCWVRRPNVKVGLGVSAEQHVTPDLGVFLRAMYSDGRTEVDAFNSADRDLSVGAVAKGALWGRSFDLAGVGYAMGFISDMHARYLALGGVDGFVGDGALRRRPEAVFETFYSMNFAKAVWLSASYQRISNPGFNADRGAVDVFGGRVHAEF